MQYKGRTFADLQTLGSFTIIYKDSYHNDTLGGIQYVYHRLGVPRGDLHSCVGPATHHGRLVSYIIVVTRY